MGARLAGTPCLVEVTEGDGVIECLVQALRGVAADRAGRAVRSWSVPTG